MSLEESIYAEVRALVCLDLTGLRDEWTRRFGAPPKLRSPELLRHLIAWRLQTAAFGDLDARTKRELAAPPRTRRTPGFAPGTRLVREWQGRAFEVEVTDEGFLLHGKLYRSLSAAAGAISGGKWNGRRFFGLDRE